jgi:hypothetical protein
MAAYVRRRGLGPAAGGPVIAGVCAGLGGAWTVSVDSQGTAADSTGRLG